MAAGPAPHVLANPAPASPPPEAPKAEASGDVNVIQIKPPIVVRDFAIMLGLKPFKLISELMEMGIFASLNQSIEENVASQIAVKHGFLLDIKHRGDQAPPKEKEKAPEPKVDESRFLEPRPPVVCIMGHVDHGKTSLLDKIRSTNVVAGEAGGITQHIGAYQVTLNDRKITFLDTPGHAAFNQMRERGANVTDIAILVVAADDGFMPQTDEALKFIRAAEVTPIVAINKIDAKGADIDRVKRQMQERDLMPEDWGGQIITVPVSALKGQRIEQLLEMILLQADVLELKANPKSPATGVVIEAEIEVGRGPTATVLVENGTLRTGDSLVCGPHFTKVRAMFDDKGKPVKSAAPSEAVRVIGWSGTPECGAIVETVKNDRDAKRIAAEREFELKKQAGAAPAGKPASIENLFQAIAAQKAKVLRVIVKADVFGSAEAVVSSLTGIKSDKVSLEVVASDVGPIDKNDVLMASAAKASIIGFNVRVESGVEALAKHHGVQVNQYEIIYELVDAVRDSMADLLEPELKEIKIGMAEVRAVFPISKGFVAGCLVTEGRVQVMANARLRRAGKVEVETRITTIRRVKDEVKEVRAGTECGIHLENYDAYQPGDLIECFDIQKLRPSL
ncbi:MAG TPA: translation initiation factor IF-2 [Opitutaceae bacterium]